MSIEAARRLIANVQGAEPSQEFPYTAHHNFACRAYGLRTRSEAANLLSEWAEASGDASLAGVQAMATCLDIAELGEGIVSIGIAAAASLHPDVRELRRELSMRLAQAGEPFEAYARRKAALRDRYRTPDAAAFDRAAADINAAGGFWFYYDGALAGESAFAAAPFANGRWRAVYGAPSPGSA